MRMVEGALIDFPLSLGCAEPGKVVDEADGARQDESGVPAGHWVCADADGLGISSSSDGTSPPLENAIVGHGEAKRRCLDVLGAGLAPKTEQALGRRSEGDTRQTRTPRNVRNGDARVSVRARCLVWAGRSKNLFVVLDGSERDTVRGYFCAVHGDGTCSL